MNALFDLVGLVVHIYSWILIIAVIMSWLISFGVVNTYNQFVAAVYSAVHRLTEPALRPIRRMLPDLGGLDIAPLVLLVALWFVNRLIQFDIRPYFT